MSKTRTLVLMLSIVATLCAVALFVMQPSSEVAELEPDQQSESGTGGLLAVELRSDDGGSTDPGALDARSSERVSDAQHAERRAPEPEREWTLRVWGRVASEEGEGIAGAELDFFFRDGSEERSATWPRQSCDDSGAFAIEVPIDREWHDVDDESLYVHIELRAWTPGYSQELAEADIDLTEEDSAELNLELYPGADVSGFVFANDGTPLAADVYLQLDGEERRHETSADEHGFYRLHLERGGSASVHARETSHGTARLAHVSIDPNVRTRIPDLFLQGSGVLGGRLVDPDGAPIAGHRVDAIAEELIGNRTEAASHWNFSTGDSPANLSAEGSDGLLAAGQSTAADGSFRFEGLRPGRYMLRAVHASEEERAETDRQLFATGVLDARLVLGVHRIVVTVDGKSGGQAVHCIEWAESAFADFGDTQRNTLRPVSQRPVTFEVTAERSYRLGLNAGRSGYLVYFPEELPNPWKVPSSEATVYIEEGRYLTRVDLRTAAVQGELLIEIDDDQTSSRYQVELTPATSGRVLRTGMVSRESLPLRIELNPGRYGVRVSPRAAPMIFGADRGMFAGGFVHGGLQAAPQRAEVEYRVESVWQEIEVLADRTFRLNFRFEAGGSLRVGLPRKTVTEPQPFLVTNDISLFGGQFSIAAPREEFELRNERGERLRGQQFTIEPQSSESARSWRKLHGGLPAGRYSLSWKPAEGDPIVVQFTIETGELTSVEVEG